MEVGNLVVAEEDSFETVVEDIPEEGVEIVVEDILEEAADNSETVEEAAEEDGSPLL